MRIIERKRVLMKKGKEENESHQKKKNVYKKKVRE